MGYCRTGLLASSTTKAIAMLFVVSESAGESLNAKPIAPHVATAFARLLGNYSDGHHVVLVEPSMCRSIEGNDTFSAEQKAAARRIRNRFADFGGLTSVVTQYATVVSEGINPHRVETGWEVPLRWIAIHPLSKSTIIGEDLNDTGLLLAAAEDFLELKGLRGFNVRATQAPGGGRNTHRVLERIAIAEQQPSVCVVDSDRACPMSPPGSTALPCTEVVGEGLFSVQLTLGRTIENALPWRLIDLVRQVEGPIASSALSALERQHPRLPAFLNMKRGLTGFDIAKLPSGDAKSFWIAAAEAVAGPPDCCEIPCDALESPLCRYKIHCGFGNALLGDVTKWLNDNSVPARVRRYLPSPNSEEWLSIGRLVSNYTLGMPPRRI